MLPQIEFFFEDTSFSLSNPSLLSEWILSTIHSENFILSSINIIFCSDSYLLSINKEYLQHDYFTDVITFDNSDFKNVIEGDIFISVDRVSENSKIYHVDFNFELYRVIIHGILHLTGYSDKSSLQQQKMREKENYYLSILNI